MAKDDMLPKLGSWIFLLGILIALIFGIYQAATLENALDDPTEAEDVFFTTDNGGTVAWILAIFGAIVGLLAAFGRGTITSKETPGFLIAGIALVVMYGVFKFLSFTGAGTNPMAIQPWLGSLLSGISLSLAIFVAPAVGVLAIKEIWDMGKDV